MSSEPEVPPFPDNWSYLKAELAWLDRLLMRAMAKQRQMQHEIDRVARSPADKASSHWWKGFINLDPAKGGSQLKSDPSIAIVHPLGRHGDRIAISLKQGIRLALPLLCQHLGLGSFERNVVVLCLALEINRRYEKLYAFLNNDDTNSRQPSVDLALRLFCRTDAEWRVARPTLLSQAPLVKNKVLEIASSDSTARSLLARTMLLSEKAVTYLLSDDAILESVLPKPRRRKSTRDRPQELRS
jgi:hypothetical protein